ncbi:PST family polysaccharide transporter [Roseinatronobacter thiooxidans]|uniref:PST family polysaccharide transporter n=1 Tax=Roseinatronobacter thiooxidans TaxID=121821 RepID=A0A2W7QHF4_9RHOB|nr:O-antigen translocase [Roseinatronobacter thiooxidans]PZX40649.1 PST family polysaccharide transporter [Roseinatronobacter thiooxidans]
MSQASYRTILRASSIVGSASVVNILAGLVKMKVAAVLLGPAGVGLIGLYQNLIQSGATIAGLGMNSAGTRCIAAATSEGDAAVDLARRALFWGALVQGVVGGLVFWLAADMIAARLLADPSLASQVVWLACGVGLMVFAGAQTAVLTGLRQIGSIARITAISGLVGAAGGVAALWVWGEGGLLALVLITPVTTFALGLVYVRRLRRQGHGHRPRALVTAWQEMAWLGVALMVSALVSTSGHLTIRVLVQRELGPEALGQFQAAWSIGMTYLTFILGAMGTDYFPRLSAIITDRAAAVHLVNQQTEVGLLLCGPVLVMMLGCAPWVIRLLYSAEFGPAVEILRWQLLGDILKVISWPLGFVLLALGAGRTFIVTETVGIGVFVLGVAIGLPLLGVTATGVAFLALYVAYLPLVWWLGGRRIGFRWSRAVVWLAGVTMAAAVAVALAARVSDGAGLVAGLACGLGLGIWSLLRLADAAGATGRFQKLANAGARTRTLLERLR